MKHAKTKQVAGWLVAGLGLWLAAGTAWAQHLAPVNPAFAKWMKDGGNSKS